MPEQSQPRQASPRKGEHLVTLLVVLISLVAWSWNAWVVFHSPSSLLASQHIWNAATHWPILSFVIGFLLGCWSDFRSWIRRHPLGAAYLAVVLGHLSWRF
jgi:hypothetical protein